MIWGIAGEMMSRSCSGQYTESTMREWDSPYEGNQKHANENGCHQQSELETGWVDNVILVLVFGRVEGLLFRHRRTW